MQTRQQSLLEVSLDFVLSLVVNLYGQRLIYGPLATAERMAVFAVVVLVVSYVRRLAMRRTFNALLLHGQRQSRRHSWLEVLSDTVVGFLLTMGLQAFFYGPAATIVRAGGLTVAIYGLAMLRRYLLRRIFVRWEVRPV